MKIALVIIFCVVLVVTILIFYPLLLLWCLKVFGVPTIIYSFKQWLAALCIIIMLGSAGASGRSRK